jgi:hypothetical protein
MNYLSRAVFGAALFGLPLFGQSAQTLVLPDVVDGGGWQSTIVLTNMSASPASATLSFNSDTTGGGTQPWTPAFLEAASTAGLVLNGGSSMFLHTPGTAATLTQGWGLVNADAGIVAYVVFTNRVPGRQDQDATAPAVAASNDVLLPYDDSNGFATAVAVVNPSTAPLTISVGFRTTTGGVYQSALPAVPPLGHMTFALAQTFPVIAGHEGLAEFYNATSNFTLISLRFNPTNSSTAAPAFFQSGAAPLIVTPAAPDPGPMPPGDPYGYYARPVPAN